MQAHTSAQVQDDLLHTKAAEQAKAARQDVLQKGGVLYAYNARKAIQRKEDDDLLEVRLAVKRAQAKAY